MNPKIGRPKSKNPRNINLNIRLTTNEAELIKNCAEILNISRTDLIVMAVKNFSEKIENKKE